MLSVVGRRHGDLRPLGGAGEEKKPHTPIHAHTRGCFTNDSLSGRWLQFLRGFGDVTLMTHMTRFLMMEAFL